MRKLLPGILASAASAAFIGLVVWIVILPRLDWGAGQKPPAIETALARNVIGRWIRRNAQTNANPLSPTSDNLKEAKSEYEEHCAACHASDGSGKNQFEAEFYPPVPRLTGAVQQFSDAEIYFIIAKGIASTAMPAFGNTHSAADIWCCVLWVRHLGNLSPAEHAAIEQKMRDTAADHEKTMERHTTLGR